jgi:hypothetical protein
MLPSPPLPVFFTGSATMGSSSSLKLTSEDSEAFEPFLPADSPHVAPDFQTMITVEPFWVVAKQGCMRLERGASPRAVLRQL